MADQKALLAAARVAVETVATTTIVPTSVLGDSAYTWTEILDDVQAAMLAAHGHAEDGRFHKTLIQFYTDLEAALAA